MREVQIISGFEGELKMKRLWQMPVFNSRTKRENVTLKEMLFGYFVGPFCVLAMTSVVASYYLTFYRTYEDIEAQKTLLTLLPLISVIPMALSNIVMGILLGKTKTAQGKARPYILVAAPLILLSGVLMFCIPDLSLGFRMVWMVITYNMFASIANPVYGTAHYLMVSLSTRDLKQRGKLSVIANIPAVAGNGLISSILMPAILSWINMAGDTAEIQKRWQMVLVIFSALAFVGCLLEYMYTRERITEESFYDCGMEPEQKEAQIQEDKVPVVQQLKCAVSDRYWWIIMIFYTLYQAGTMFKGGYVFNIFCHEYFETCEIFGMTLSADMVQSVLALISGIPLAGGMLFIWPLANKFGKKNMVLVGCVVSVAGSLVCLSNPYSFEVMLAGQILKGFSSIPGAYIMMALFADVLDHLEARFGYRVDGISMSIYNTILTVINGLAIAFFNFFYDNASYNSADVTAFFFLGYEVIAHGILIVVLCFLTVEKNVEEEQALIKMRKEN